MPYLDTAQEWLSQSALLLQARPTTTRITTKYTIKPLPDPSKPSKRERKPKPTPEDAAAAPTTPAPPTTPAEPIRATLTLKTYDPASGTTLKYSTTKAAEVSRLIQILGKLGRGMAGLPELKEDVIMADVGEGSGVATPVVENVPKVGGSGAGGQQPGGKKKKGKGKK